MGIDRSRFPLLGSRAAEVRPIHRIRARLTAWIAVVSAALGLGLGSPARAAATDSLPPLAEAAISAAIGQQESTYHAKPGRAGLRMQNPDNGFSVAFSSGGIELERSADRFGMRLRGAGRGKALRAVSSSSPRASGSRVEYPREGFVEWYANGPLGLEQGITLAKSAGHPEEGPVTLDFVLEGGLGATLDPDARGATLLRGDSPVLRYADLASIDAEGRALPTWLELDGDHLRLRVDDTGARYPVTVDPVLSSIRLTNDRSLCTIGGICEAGNPGDAFGASVAVSSDGSTVVVAAPFATGSNPGSGAVYVFRKPSFGGWSGCITVGCLDYVAKLTSTPGLTQHGFGAAVAMSGDASTIAVLTDTLGNADSSAGIIYVYQRPSNGWVSTGSHAAILSLTGLSETPCGLQGNATDCNTDFTSSLDVDGTGSTIVLGYSGALVGGRSKGAAYVYVRPATGWVNSAQPFKLTRASGALRDLLGQAVSISADGSTIAASAPQANGFLGAVDVFLKGGAGWASQTQSAELTYTPGNGLLFLGNSVDVNANGTLVIAGGNGRALVFPQPRVQFCSLRGGCFFLDLWGDRNESAVLSGSNGSPIGWPRLSEDGTKIVAAGFESTGTLYTFLRPSGGWVSGTESARFSAASGMTGDRLGYSTIVGAPAFGMSSDASTIVAGAPGTTIGARVGQGAAHVFLPEPAAAAGLAGGVSILGLLGARRGRGARR